MSSIAQTFNHIMWWMIVLFFVILILVSQVGNRLGTKQLVDHYYIYPEASVNISRYANLSLIAFIPLLNSFFPLDFMLRNIAVQITYALLFLENDADMMSVEHSTCVDDPLVGASIRTVGVLEDLGKVN